MGDVRDSRAAVSGERLTDRIGVGVLTRLIDRDLVDDVLAETGRVEQRSRLLPARVVVYYVLGLSLFFGEAYEEVMRLIVDGLRFLGAWRKEWRVPTTGAITQARQRLGAEPLRVLFERVAVPCALQGTQGAWLGSRRLMAIDGFVLDVPDTDGRCRYQVRAAASPHAAANSVAACPVISFWRVVPGPHPGCRAGSYTRRADRFVDIHQCLLEVGGCGRLRLPRSEGRKGDYDHEKPEASCPRAHLTDGYRRNDPDIRIRAGSI